MVNPHLIYSIPSILLGLGGYQILSLRLEFRVLVFVAICFISISSLYRLQHNDNELLKEYLRDNDTRAVANKLSKTLYDNFQRIIKRILTQLDNNKSLDLALPLCRSLPIVQDKQDLLILLVIQFY